MRHKFNDLQRERTVALIILGSFLAGILIGNLAESYRFSDQRWLYSLGKPLGLLLALGAVPAAIANTIIQLKTSANTLH
ncbi:hypothetical protein CRP01_37515 [Flavilitoribacter nigricans DSM 23189 = NBRC 102662]|uniref:Uncharacterized protein n=1 Tax=Flavilitoribacter nigricans (strain ATCC 23147 / DSM 23189 / NBRC 102662 / NCIMB 1420 / SS-2) TaxID=1122177 RepID=A0A2D0MYR3_FLAN2|nr:hypothetical protein CRP01_37515 [Flavilitoribacter nigricans DSM 23189 = NBRC 102662]